MRRDEREAERRRDRTEGRPEHGGADPQNCPPARLPPPTSFHHFFSWRSGAMAVQIQYSARPPLSPPPAARLPTTYHHLSWRAGAIARQTWTPAVSCRRTRTEGDPGYCWLLGRPRKLRAAPRCWLPAWRSETTSGRKGWSHGGLDAKLPRRYFTQRRSSAGNDPPAASASRRPSPVIHLSAALSGGTARSPGSRFL